MQAAAPCDHAARSTIIVVSSGPQTLLGLHSARPDHSAACVLTLVLNLAASMVSLGRSKSNPQGE
eukprot:13644685-Alexandrium_andersonii.AAC.1